MGKKKRLNRLITKWIKSDLPEDHSTVLLLGVTRIPTSPTPVRRPCSLPLSNNTILSFDLKSDISHRNTTAFPSDDERTTENIQDTTLIKECDKKPEQAGTCGSSSSNNHTTTTPIYVTQESKRAPLLMDQSVDSIGTCSLDIDASVELQDWSEASSLRTLRSESIIESETPQEQHKLPSYLSLACTVNGYSTTTNYDPERLARSRDTSPHRLHDHDHQPVTAYSIHNNLLSPPNLVPLPTPKTFQVKNNLNTMEEQTITTHHHQKFYSSTKTITYVNKESHNFSSSIFSADTVDTCLDNNRKNLIQNKTYDCKNYSYATNGQNKDTTSQKYSKVDEAKSFIEQRIERLYGPGALAHGFLVMKKQHSKSFEMEKEQNDAENHSKSMLDQFLVEESDDATIKQSTSFPSLPVLRHLRPEFRAQLPIFNSKKGLDTMSKSNTIPVIKEETKTNGLSGKDTIHLNGNVNSQKNAESDEKNGNYFITILENENKRLLYLADVAEKELEDPNLPEEAKGFLRSASGKARLLVSQKMQQFKGLCTKNITQVEGEAFPTTNEDLQGFWDMVMLQVDQIDKLFKELETLKANNWVEKTHDVVDNGKSKVNGSTTKMKKVSRIKFSAEAEEARKQREIERKKIIEERRKAMREQKLKANSSPQQNIEIFVPESS